MKFTYVATAKIRSSWATALSSGSVLWLLEVIGIKGDWLQTISCNLTVSLNLEVSEWTIQQAN